MLTHGPIWQCPSTGPRHATTRPADHRGPRVSDFKKKKMDEERRLACNEVGPARWTTWGECWWAETKGRVSRSIGPKRCFPFPFIFLFSAFHFLFPISFIFRFFFRIQILNLAPNMQHSKISNMVQNYILFIILFRPTLKICNLHKIVIR
jgi:hypothetical protein